MSDDIVYFNMPDGTKVSNDPRWLAEQAHGAGADAAMEVALEATPYTGNEGIPDAEMAAQVGGGLAPGQSGQEGVGPSPTASVEEMARGKVTGAVMSHDAADIARERGATPDKPLVDPPETPDSNEAVLEVREQEQKRQEAAAKAVAALAEAGEDAGDPDKPYSEWSAKQLKAELLRRNSERGADSQIDKSGLKSKKDVAAALEDDDNSRG